MILKIVRTLSLGMVLLHSNMSRADKSDQACLDWAIKNIEFKEEILQKDISTYHWLKCNTLGDYKDSGDFSKISADFVKRKASSTSNIGFEGGGLYLATDPSATCNYGGKYKRFGKNETPCLVVIDFPKGSTITNGMSGDDKLYENLNYLIDLGCYKKEYIKEVYEDLAVEFKKVCQRPGADKTDCAKGKKSKTMLKLIQENFYFAFDTMTVFRNADREKREKLQNLINDKKRHSSISYKYITTRFNPKDASHVDSRALVLRKDLLPKVKVRTYEVTDLMSASQSKAPRDSRTQEALNIVSHMSSTPNGQLCIKSMGLKKPKAYDPSLTPWLKKLASEYSFKDIVKEVKTTESVVETQPEVVH